MKNLFTFALVCLFAADASAQFIKLYPRGVTYKVQYLAGTGTDKVCFYSLKDGALEDRDGSGALTESDAVKCEAPARTCDLPECAGAAPNEIEFTVPAAKTDFLVAAVASRVVDGQELSSDLSNQALALASPVAPILVR